MSEQGITFDASSREASEDERFGVFRLSWVAYLREGFSFMVRLLILAVAAMLLTSFLPVNKGVNWLSYLAFFLAIAWTIYSVALTKTVRIFTNESGVWMQSGIFPWQKGTYGMKWSDVGQAGYTQGFTSWALKSYELSVTHRFTAGAELIVKHVYLGDKAAMHINDIMKNAQNRIQR
jgi:hypothetical protein